MPANTVFMEIWKECVWTCFGSVCLPWLIQQIQCFDHYIIIDSLHYRFYFWYSLSYSGLQWQLPACDIKLILLGSIATEVLYGSVRDPPIHHDLLCKLHFQCLFRVITHDWCCRLSHWKICYHRPVHSDSIELTISCLKSGLRTWEVPGTTNSHVEKKPQKNKFINHLNWIN